MNHTPLPWTFGKVKEDGAISYFIAGPDGCDIAHFPWSLDTERPEGVTEANVRLFFAAPRLLENLERALRIIDNALPPSNEPVHICTPESCCDMDCMERAAIGKGINEIRSLLAEVKGPAT